jgi:hypothetical protein
MSTPAADTWRQQLAAWALPERITAAVTALALGLSHGSVRPPGGPLRRHPGRGVLRGCRRGAAARRDRGSTWAAAPGAAGLPLAPWTAS